MLKTSGGPEIHSELCSVYGQYVMCEELHDNGAESSKMGKQMFTMKSEMVGGHL
jgi:hypothetical protein